MNRDQRIDAILPELKRLDDEFDAAGGELASSIFAGMAMTESDREQALRQFSGRYGQSVEKTEKRFEREKDKLSRQLLERAAEAELARDEYGRKAGANPPMILSEIAEAVVNGTLDELTDKYFTVPMALASQGLDQPPQFELIDVPDQPPPLAPPPPPQLEPAEPPVVPLVPPPASVSPPPPFVPAPGPVPPPTYLPGDPCPLPIAGYHPPGAVVLPPAQPGPPGWSLWGTFEGCNVWQPPPVPVPVIPPTVPPVVPPPKPPPPVPPADPCQPPSATVQTGCSVIPYPWVSYYWYTLFCRPDCQIEVCSYYGPTPPDVPPGRSLRGPFTTPQDTSQWVEWSKGECRLRGIAPVEPLPPPGDSPPTAPPDSPPGTSPPPTSPPPPTDEPVPPPFEIVIPPPSNDDLQRLCSEAVTWISAANGGEFGAAGTIWADSFGKLLFARGNGGVADLLANLMEGVTSAAFGSIFGGLDRLGIPNATAQARILPAQGVLGWLERLTAAPVTYLGEEWAQYMRFASPMFLPSQASVDSQYLAGVISDQEWECLTKFNGNKPEHARRTVEASRVRPGVMDLISLFRRGVIARDIYLREMRRLGVLNDDDRVRLEAAQEQTPGVSDIFRYIKKDVTNDEFVRLGGLDEGFEETYQGKVREWGDAIGLTVDQARYEYRSEWEFPSNTQLYEMVRRLRPGRVQRFNQVQPDGSLVSFKPEPVTVQDALQVLKVNETAPAWRERILAISYVPINLTEIKALQKNGVIDREEVIERLQDIGKSPADARVLAELVERDNARMLSNETGGWTRRQTIKEYTDGTISAEVAREFLSRTIPDPKIIDQLIRDADLRRDANSRRECIKGVRRMYFVAAFTEDQATFELTRYGVARPAAETMVAGWQCARNSRATEPRVKMLQEWWQRGIITSQELFTRLVRLGYLLDDAERIVKATVAKDEERRLKEAETARRQAEADGRRRKREAAAEDRRRRREQAAS